MTQVRQRILGRPLHWGLLFAIIIATFFANIPTARAADGYDISNMGSTTGQALGTNIDGSLLCAVWSQFDVSDPAIYLRIYNRDSGSWTPSLGSDPITISDGGANQSPRCTIDTSGNTHVVWQKRDGVLNTYHRYRSANGSLSNVTQVGSDRSQPDIDSDQNGTVWTVSRVYQSGFELRSWTLNGGWSGTIGFNSGDADKPRIGADNLGNVHVSFKNNGVKTVTRRADGSFTSVETMPNSGSSGDADIAVNRTNGDVHILYVKEFNQLHYGKRSLGGSLSSQQVATGTTQIDQPTIAWSAAGSLIAAFNDGAGSYVGSINSTNDGGSFSSIQRVTDNAPPASPWAVADALGNGYVVYNNRSNSRVYFTTIGTVRGTPSGPICSPYTDVQQSNPACTAIQTLTSRGVIAGYTATTFGPNDPVQRAQMAAFIVRALSWDNRPQGPRDFNDLGALSNTDLPKSVRIAANACDARGRCVAAGYGDGRFGPTDQVTYAQVIAFLARAFEIDQRYAWQEQPNGAQLETGVPAVHDTDVRTFNYYRGAVVAAPTTEAGWNAPAPRAWVARALYQAIYNAR